jgi:hypothetical protein
MAVYGNASGRVNALATDPRNPAVVYAGTDGGGVWKSADGGGHWMALTDGGPSLTIGSVAVDPNNSQVVYAGTGETYGVQPGMGILKSTDAGASWTALGTSQFAGVQVNGLLVEKTGSPNPRVFAATSIGLYVSITGGAIWTKVDLSVAGISGITRRPPPSQAATQIIQDPSSPAKFWVSVSDLCYTEAGDILTGDGLAWTNVTPPGLTDAVSRIGLGVGPNGVAYYAAASCTGDLVDLERTMDGGTTWTRFPNTTPGLTNYFKVLSSAQGDYDNVVAVDPLNPAHAVFGGVDMLATTTGTDANPRFVNIGRVYTGGVIHPDHHAVAFTSSDRFYAGNDGGVYSTSNLGGAGNPTPGTASDWTNLNSTLDTIEFHRGTALDIDHFLGGTQDNGAAGILPGGPSRPSWQQYKGGDVGFTAIDPTPGSSTVYVAHPAPPITLLRGSSILNPADPYSPHDSFVEAGPCRFGSAPPDPACGDPALFINPFVMDPTNPLRLLAGTNRLWLTSTGGLPAGPGGWSAISNDLTIGTSIVPFQDALSTIGVGSAGAAGPVMTGSALGKVYLSTQLAGTTPTPTTWIDITGNLPASTAARLIGIRKLTLNPANPSEAWVSITGKNIGHVWHTTNAGAPGGTNWADISGSGPTGIGDFAPRSMVVDPDSSSTIYAGTTFGTMVCSSCGGTTPDARWLPLGNGLPNVRVEDLTITRDGKSIIAWTQGRGAWSLARPRQTSFYFAEGYTGAGFSERLSLLMPNQSGGVMIDYYTAGGGHSTGSLMLTAGRVGTVDVNVSVGPNQQVSVKVTLPGPGVVERVIHFDTGTWHGSTDQVGTTAPSTEWDFAEGSTFDFFNEYLTLQNPNQSAVPVSLNYFTDTGLSPVKTLTLAAGSRTTVEVFNGTTTNVTNCLPSGAGASCGVGRGIGGVSVQVIAGAPIIAERPFYVNGFNFGDGLIRDGHDAFGASAPARLWSFAEGTTLAGFKEYVTLQNPGGTDATVSLNYFTDSGQKPVKTLTAKAHSRVTVEVFKGSPSDVTNCVASGPAANCGVGPGIGGVSLQVSSTVPIVAERPMYMYVDFGTGPVAGAHIVVGATSLGKLFGFAAASTLAGENDYLTIQNPGTIVANVKATYYTSTGPVVKNFQVAAGSRRTVEVFKVTDGAGPGISQLGIVISSDQPVLVEKPTYNSTPAGYGATDTLGYAPPAGF